MSDFKFCPKCGGQIFIDEWNGWRWSCIRCEYVGPDATEKEIDEQQQWFIKAKKKREGNNHE